MKKLLHERLREVQASTGLLLCDLLVKTLGIPREKTDICTNRVPAIAGTIADEIEKYYIPRPRFDDGEPVQSSDMEEIGGLATCCVYTDGSWNFDHDKYEDERNPKPWDEQQGRQCDFIKRPEPKVLDAEGVSCKKGETVWTRNGESGIIASVHNADEQPTPHAVRRGIPFIRYEGGRWNYADEISHREPDSYEKLRDDILDTCEPITSVTKQEWADRLTALMERDV